MYNNLDLVIYNLCQKDPNYVNIMHFDYTIEEW